MNTKLEKHIMRTILSLAIKEFRTKKTSEAQDESLLVPSDTSYVIE